MHSSPVKVVVTVCKDVVLWDPETEQWPEQDQTSQDQVEVMSDQGASQNPGQESCDKLQGSVQKSDDESDWQNKLCRQLLQLLQVDFKV